MSDRNYSRAVEKELIRLARLVAERQDEARLAEIASLLNDWTKKNGSPGAVLEDIRRVALAVPPPWSAEADPGVPVAQGIAEGLLSEKDMSSAAWKAVQILVAVVEV